MASRCLEPAGASEMTMVFASLNVGLQESEACGKNAERRFKAIACGVAKAFRHSRVQVMGLVEVGDAENGLPPQQSTLLKQHIRDALTPDKQFNFHSDAVGSLYMLLSRSAVLGACRIDFTNVRVVTGFLTQKWRKALRATFTGPGAEVDLWLVDLESSNDRKLTSIRRQEMLKKLLAHRPTIIAGDISTTEIMLCDWMQHDGARFNPSVACSGAKHPRHGDLTIAVNTIMWQVDHRVGRSFEPSDVGHVSDAHDMVCIALRARWADADELGGRPEEEASSSQDPTTADVAELGGATTPWATFIWIPMCPLVFKNRLRALCPKHS